MTIGLYDIDLHHGSFTMPNLELMKYFSYYYNTNNQVIMMRPQDDEGRFEKIIYFKESPKTDIPNSLNLYGERKILYGRGFFGRTEQLPDFVSAAKPSFLPYDPYGAKVGAQYETIRKSSLLRVENNDRSGFKDTQIIYIVDYLPTYQPNLISEMESLPNHYFKFFHSFRFNDIETYDKLKGYFHLIKNTIVYIHFNFSAQFFLSNYTDNFFFVIPVRPNESSNEYLHRIFQIILTYKRTGKSPRVGLAAHYPMKKEIERWARAKTNLSFAQFFKNNKVIRSEILTQPMQNRLLMKTECDIFNVNTLDF